MGLCGWFAVKLECDVTLGLSLLTRSMKIEEDVSCSWICSLQKDLSANVGYRLLPEVKTMSASLCLCTQERKCVQETVRVCARLSHIKKTSGGIPETPEWWQHRTWQEAQGGEGEREGGMKGKVEQAVRGRNVEAVKSLGNDLFHCTPCSTSPPNQSPLICFMLNTKRLREDLFISGALPGVNLTHSTTKSPQLCYCLCQPILQAKC